MDRILIEGLELFARHGVRPEEQEAGQIFSFEVELQGDFTPTRDQLSETVDYMMVIRLIDEFNQTQRFCLIESLAGALVERILDDFPRVVRARVRVKKHPTMPPGLRLGSVAAEIQRERPHG